MGNHDSKSVLLDFNNENLEIKIQENKKKEYSVEIKAENEKSKELLIGFKISGNQKNVMSAVKNITLEIDQFINIDS